MATEHTAPAAAPVTLKLSRACQTGTQGLASTFRESINCSSECMDFMSLVSTKESEKWIQTTQVMWVPQDTDRSIFLAEVLPGSREAHSRKKATCNYRHWTLSISSPSPDHGNQGQNELLGQKRDWSPSCATNNGVLPVLLYPATTSATAGSVPPPFDTQTIRLMSFVT